MLSKDAEAVAAALGPPLELHAQLCQKGLLAGDHHRRLQKKSERHCFRNLPKISRAWKVHGEFSARCSASSRHRVRVIKCIFVFDAKKEEDSASSASHSAGVRPAAMAQSLLRMTPGRHKGFVMICPSGFQTSKISRRTFAPITATGVRAGDSV